MDGTGYPTTAANIFGLAAVLCARFVFGLDWIPSAFIFLPTRGLLAALAANDGVSLVKHITILLLFPLVMQLSSTLSANLISFITAKGRKVDDAALLVAGTCTTALVLALAYAASHMVSSLFGRFSLPKGVHYYAVLAVEASSRVLFFVFAILVVRFCNARFFTIPPPLKVALAVLIGTGVAVSLVRLFRGGPSTPSAGGSPAMGKIRVQTRPTTRLADVVGMDEAKEQIRLRMLEPVRNPWKARKYGLSVGGGVLLYGPPGTGKTMLARAVAGELSLPFFMITAADVFGKYVGESERNIRGIFAEVRRNKMSVLFIDELETLFPKRSGDVHEATRKVISVILQELDGIDNGRNPILLLGATNVPWMVDEAFLRPGRFDIKIFVGLPDAQARRKMLSMAFAKGNVPLERGLLDFMAERTENYSGADLNGVVDRLRQLAYASGADAYRRPMAEKAIASVSPTANGELLDKIEDWESQFLPSNSNNSGSSGMLIAARPEERLDDVAGMDAVKEEIRLRLIAPTKDATLAGHYGLHVGGGMLLYGPPGTGKTFIARAVAGELDLPFYAISAADIFGKYVGESERNIKRIFRDIRKNRLSVVFIDELEALFPRRTADVHETTRKVISLLLQELDGVNGKKNPMLLIGATNVPWMVDEAFLRPGRFDVLLYIGPPDLAARRQMAYGWLDSGSVPYEVGLDAHIAEHTEGFTGADLKGLFERLRQHAFKNRLSTYTKATADEILNGFSPSRNDELIAKIRAWESSR